MRIQVAAIKRGGGLTAVLYDNEDKEFHRFDIPDDPAQFAGELQTAAHATLEAHDMVPKPMHAPEDTDTESPA